KLQRTNQPFVLVDRSPLGINADIVESNHEQGAYLATEHLLAQGHSKILILVPLPIILPVQLRIRGYERALIKAGLEPQPDWNIGVDPKLSVIGAQENRRWYGGYRTILPVLKQSTPPLAVFALDNTTGWGVYQACQELGLRIPEDISVICFDDSDVALGMAPPMTTVAQQTDEIGRVAIELLERRFRRSDDIKRKHLQTFTRVVVDVKLIERQSVARLVDG
ncbi:MAG: substrate-binding domain-containing protein, partial [Planctomycetota bacterium]